MFPAFENWQNFNTCEVANWYPSAQNYDLSSGTPWGSINIHWNQSWDDMLARQNLYNVPSYNFGNMYLYGNNFMGNSFLCDPRYTLAQMSWGNNNTFGGTNFGNWQMPWGNMGWNPSITPGTSDNKTLTAEERAYNRKYNRLLALCKQLKDYNKLSDTVKDELEVAIRDTKGTPKEKFDKLKAAFDKVDDQKVKAFLVEAKKIGPDKFDNVDEIDSFYGELLQAGYEYSASDIDSEIEKIDNAIKNLRTNSNQEAENVLAHITAKTSSYSILDLLSSWNTQNKGSDKRNIISYITTYYNNADNKTTAKEKLIAPLVTSLTDEARKYLDELDETSKEKIEKAIDKVTKGLDNTNETVDSTLAKAFDELYTLTRQAAIVVLQNKINTNYGTIDSEIFNDKLFIDETMKDLEEEGVISDKNKKVDIIISDENKALREENIGSGERDEEITVEEQVKDMVSEGIMEKTSEKIKVNEKEYEVYQEVKETGERNYVRKFVIIEDKLNEITTNSDGKIELKERNAEDIESDYNAKLEEEEQEKIKKEEEIKNNKEADGQLVWTKLCEWTTKDDARVIASKIKDIDESNIYTFLKGVYGDKTKCGCEGLIEKLDDDTSSKIVTMEYKKQIIDAVLIKAEELGLQDTDEYKTLKSDYELFKAGNAFADKKTFNPTKKGGIGIIFGVHTNYNESIDQCIFALYQQMKALENTQK